MLASSTGERQDVDCGCQDQDDWQCDCEHVVFPEYSEAVD